MVVDESVTTNWPFKKDKSILIVVWKQIETRILYFPFGMILLPHRFEINAAKSDACVQAKGDGRWDVCLQNQYLDSRISLFIFRILGFVTLLFCQCIFDNKNLKQPFPSYLFTSYLCPQVASTVFQCGTSGAGFSSRTWSKAAARWCSG